MTTIDVKYEDLREGDLVTLRGCAYPETTVTSIASTFGGSKELFARLDALTKWQIVEQNFVSATRDIPDLPTEPGVYADKEGELYWRGEIDHWWWLRDWRTPVELGDELLRKYAPFTRLVPETDVEAARAEGAKAEREKIATAMKADGYPQTAKRIEQGDYS